MGSRSNDPYFNARRAKIILFSVLLVHVCIVAVPMIFSMLTEYFDPPLIVMKVGIADLPLGDSPDAGQPAQADAASEPDPISIDDIPTPTKVDPLPPEPKVVQKKTDVAPPKTEQKKDPPKQDVKPVTTPPKQDKPKTEQKKDPPKSNILKPEDIIKPKNTKTQAQIDAERKAREAAEKARQDAEKARQQAIADIRSAAGTKPGTFGTTNPGEDGILATKEMRDYYEQLNAFIRPKWNAVSPSSIELGGKISNWPLVELTISKKGEVTNSVFVSQSGNKKIDDAVKLLLADLKVVPAPPQAAKIRVTLDIR